MKEITILSGKGGTGKTSITAALASVARNSVFCDSDVDAADLHLILQPEILKKYVFQSSWVASINSSKCTSCGLCTSSCRFDAIHESETGDLFINPFQCEGCRLCERVCPDEAISSVRNNNNFWYESKTRFGPFVHAKMGPGEENSGKLVTQVRKRAKELALQTEAQYLLNDGPPGIGCATISAISGSHMVVMVVEPTKSGLHDAVRLIKLIDSFDIPVTAIINRFDLNTEMATKIEKFLNEKEIKVLAKIPFAEEMVKAMIEGKSIVEYHPESTISQSINLLWLNILSQLNTNKMVKHIALETTDRDIQEFYVRILGGKIVRKFKLNEDEALKKFRIPEQIEVVEVQLQNIKLELFIYEVFEHDSLQHICLQLNNAPEIFEKALQNKYRTHLRKIDKSQTYFIKDNNGNVFEIKDVVPHYEMFAE